MTIIYQYKVATTSFFGFFKLLRRWRGSVYKLMFQETIVFCVLYTVLSLVYRFVLNSHQRSLFESIAAYCNSYTSLIPVSFVLGFYVSIIVHRWWQQFTNVPWPDRTLYILGSYLVGLDEQGRIYRRTVARYMLFGLILILRSVSVSVMKRYPTMEHIVDAGFITQQEVVMYENVECKYNKFWVPLVWANSVLTQARKDGRIDSEIGFRLIVEQIADFRDKCSLCFVYDWITIPLVYTQVVTLSVYMFFGACLIGRQYVDNDEGHPDLYVPFFTLLQFFFYMGWLKVAEQMINPFGEDDDDYDMNWLIDRHTAVAMCLVDQCHNSYPPLIKDVHFNEIVSDLPYTEAAMSSKRPNFLGSTYNLERGVFGGSRDTIKSSSTMMNGHVGLGPLNSAGFQREHKDSRGSGLSDGSRYDIYASTSDLPEEYVPLRRARASTDAPHPTLHRVVDNERERKWSFPLNMLRKNQEKEAVDRGLQVSVSSISSQEDVNSYPREDMEPLLTPTLPRSRFVVETVPGDHNVDASKQARNKQIIDKHMTHMSVSRPPVLSAIEEGNTIRSVKDLIPSPSTQSLEANEENPHHVDGEIPIPTTIAEEEPCDDVFHNDEQLHRYPPDALHSGNRLQTEKFQTKDAAQHEMIPNELDNKLLAEKLQVYVETEILPNNSKHMPEIELTGIHSFDASDADDTAIVNVNTSESTITNNFDASDTDETHTVTVSTSESTITNSFDASDADDTLNVNNAASEMKQDQGKP